jgi:phosphohistidine phosphatase
MRIYLLRHGTAEDRLDGGVDHPDRRLVNRGKKQAALVASLFETMDVRFDRAVSSPYARARETAEAVLRFLPSPPQLELNENLQPDGRPQNAIEAIIGDGTVGAVLAVGHEPQLSMIAGLLTGSSSMRLDLRKGGLVELELLSMEPPRAELLGLLRPRHLRAKN